MSVYKYPSIFSRQMEAIVYLLILYNELYVKDILTYKKY